MITKILTTLVGWSGARSPWFVGLGEVIPAFLEAVRVALEGQHVTCVFVSGFLEVAVSAVLSEYASSRTHPNVARYVSSQLRGFQNPKMEKILSLLESFSPEWADQLRSDTQGQLKDAVDSIVAVRHQIAHGQSTGIMYGTIRAYYVSARRFVDLLCQQCG